MKTIFLSGAAFCAYCSLLVSLALGQPGSIDTTFNIGTGENSPSTYCLAIQTNGQIVIGGTFFNSFNGFACMGFARLNTNGSVDTTFDPGGGVSGSGVVTCMAIQPDGSIVVGGGFTSVNGLPENPPARLRTDGSVDTSFNAPAVNMSMEALALQSDGKVLIGGYSTETNGMERLNTDGTVDLTFNAGRGVFGNIFPAVNAIGLQSSGQIIAGGTFSNFNGFFVNYLVRLNTNGSVDSTFNSGIGYLPAGAGVMGLAVTPLDQVVIVGSFANINGYARGGVARINSNGDLDTTFIPGISGQPSAVALQADGKAVVANGSTVYRLNTDGSLDTSFNAGSGGGYVYCIASQSDGKTIVGGDFSTFSGAKVSGIVRLNGDDSTAPVLSLSAQPYFGMNITGVVGNTYQVQWTGSLSQPQWLPLVNVTLQTTTQFVADSNAISGQRFYRAVQIAP